MLDAFLGKPVVADLDAGYLVFGTLVEASTEVLVFADADLHDHAEANATKEVYALETKRFGIRANRRQVLVPRQRLVALSLLEDVCD